MADPPPTRQRHFPVGYRFCPTEEELITYYLRHKLLALHPSIYNTIPEIDLCKYEPWDLLGPDDSECYFYTRPDYKYSNSARLNRTTSQGFWKVTGKDRQIKERDTNKVFGIKKNLVYYEGRVPHGVRRNWVIHEYHDYAMLPREQRTYVICKLMNKYEKETKGKNTDFEHELIDGEMEPNVNSHVDFGHENQANFTMVSEEHHLPNMNSTIQTYYQPPEVTDSLIQASFQPNEDMNSFFQTYSQPNESMFPTIQAFAQSYEVLPPELDSIMNSPLDDFDF